MAGLFKNIAKSLLTKTLPDIAASAFPTVAKLERDLKSNLNEASGVGDELKSKMSGFKENFNGMGNIHRTMIKQLSTGNFGTSKADQDLADLKAMGIDADSLSDFKFGDDESSDGGDTNVTQNINVNINKSHVPSGVTDGDVGVIQSVAKQTSVSAHGAMVNAKLLSSINHQIGLLNTFHIQRTSAYYDLSIESMKGMVAGQDKLIDDLRPMAEHYKAQAEAAAMRHVNRGDPDQVLNPANFLKKINDHFLTSDLVLGAAGSKVKQAINDPIGTAAAVAGAAVMRKFAGGLIDQVENFAKDLPYMAQSMFEKWAGNRDYSKHAFSLQNLLATVGDTMKLDTGGARIQVNRDEDGPVSFDAKTRRSIVTEIPGYLAKMLRELEVLNGAFHSANNMRRRDVDHQVYDEDSGSFTREGEIKKRMQNRIKEIDEGKYFGGLGDHVDRASRSAGLSKKEAEIVQKHMLKLGNSTVNGDVQVSNLDNVMAHIKQYAEQTYKRKANHSDTQHEAAKARHIASLSSQDSATYKAFAKFTSSLNNSGSGAGQLEADIQAKRAQIQSLNGEERVEAEKQLGQMMRRHKELKRGNISQTSQIQSALLRHPMEQLREADHYANGIRDKAESKVYAINNTTGELAQRVNIRSNGAMPGAALPDRLNRMGSALRGPMEDFMDVVAKASDKIENAIDRVSDFVSDKAKKGWEWTKNKASTLSDYLHGSLIMPLKERLLGDKKERAKNFSLMKSITFSFERNVIFPMKKWMLGTDDVRKIGKSTFVQAMGVKFDSVMLNFKTFLLGNEKMAKKLTFMQTISRSFETRILRPMKTWMFGQENQKKSFFTNITEWMGPRVNKFLFGDKAKDNSLWTNIKDTVKETGAFIKDKVFAPMKNWVTKELWPGFKDMMSEIGGEIKRYGVKIKDFFTKDLVKGAKGVMNTILGDDTIAKLRKNIVDPFANAVKKLGESLGGVLKFFMRIPVNFFRGVADTIKLKRMERGEGNFSDEEKERLNTLKRENRVFDWKNKGGPAAQMQEGIRQADQQLPDQMREVGQHTVDGLTEGIEQNADQPIEATITMAQKMVAGIRKALGIHSPSREMMEVGQHVVEGLVLGIENNQERIRRAMNNVRDEITDVEFTETPNGAPSAAPKAKSSPMGDIKSILERIEKSTSSTEKLSNENLPAIASNTKGILDAMNGLGGNNAGQGGRRGGFFGRLQSFLGNMMRAPIDAVSGILKSLKDVPGKLLGVFTSAFGQTFSILGKIIPSMMEGVGKAVSAAADAAGKIMLGLSKGIGKALTAIGPMVTKLGDSLINVTTKMLEVGVSFGKHLFSAIRPLTNGLVDLGSTILKGMQPAVSQLTTMLGSAVVQLANFTKSVLNAGLAAGKFLLEKAGSLAGRFGMKLPSFGFGGGGAGASATMAITNWRDMVGASRRNPLYVHVVDGKIQTYKPRGRASVRMTNNTESLPSIVPGKKKEEGEQEEGGLADMAGGALAGLAGGAAGGLIARAKGALGNIGGFIMGRRGPRATPAPTGAPAAAATEGAGSRASNAARRAAARTAMAGSTGPTGSFSNMDRVARGMAQGGAAGAPAAAQGGGLLSRMGAGLKSMYGGGVKGAVGGLAKAGKTAAGGLGLGAAISMGGGALTNLFTEEGSKTNKILNGIFGTVGDAATGAAVGSFIPVIGNVVGGVIGALTGTFTRLIPAIEDAFSEEIQSFTTSVLEFPEKFTKWVDLLPGKVESFMNDLPTKILSLFDSPTEADLDPNTGLPMVDKPSILWKLVKALGNAGLVLVSKMPDIGAALAKSLGTIIGSGVVTLGGFIVKGITKVAFGIENMIDDAVAGATNWLANSKVGKFIGMKGESEEEAQQRKVARARRQDAQLASLDSSIKDAAKAGGEIGGKVGGAAASIIGGTVGAPIKGISALAGAAAGGSKDRDVNRYEEAMKASGGDEAKAKEYAKKKFGDDMSYWDKAKGASTAEAKRVSDDRYMEWLKMNKYDASKETRARFDAMEKGEKDLGRSSSLTSYGSKEVQEAIANAAAKYGIDHQLLTKMAIVESGMKPDAVSSTGAKGLFQFVGSTGAEFGMKSDKDFFNPYINADAGARYIKRNMQTLQMNNVPVNQLTLYMAHQLGGAGAVEIWNSAIGRRTLSEDRMKAMKLNNPGLSGNALFDPKTYISAWDKKLGTGIMPFGNVSGALAAVKVDNRISGGSPGAKAQTLMASTTPSSAPMANSSKAAAATPAPLQTVAAATATPSVGNGNAVAGASPTVANKDGLATVAAADSMKEKYNAGAAIHAASGSNGESALLAELRKANTALSAIAGNTKDMQTNIATSVVEATKVAISSANSGSQQVAAATSSAGQKAITRVSTDLFGNLAKSGSGPVPSKDAMRIASGLNMV
jgi:hypothetical protein